MADEIRVGKRSCLQNCCKGCCGCMCRLLHGIFGTIALFSVVFFIVTIVMLHIRKLEDCDDPINEETMEFSHISLYRCGEDDEDNSMKYGLVDNAIMLTPNGKDYPDTMVMWLVMDCIKFFFALLLIIGRCRRRYHKQYVCLALPYILVALAVMTMNIIMLYYLFQSHNKGTMGSNKTFFMVAFGVPQKNMLIYVRNKYVSRTIEDLTGPKLRLLYFRLISDVFQIVFIMRAIYIMFIDRSLIEVDDV